jgi:hypothetical protein
LAGAEGDRWDPSVQLLIDPDLNPELDTLWVLGLRAGLAL